MANTDITREITESMLSEIAAVLASNYKQLPYIYDVVKNNFKTSKSRYGARPLGTIEIDGVVKSTTHIQSFQVVLTEGFTQSAIGDSTLQDKALTAFDNMQIIYKQFAANKAGVPGSVLIVQNLSIDEPEVLEEDKVVVLRATVDVMYRIEI